MVTTANEQGCLVHFESYDKVTRVWEIDCKRLDKIHICLSCFCCNLSTDAVTALQKRLFCNTVKHKEK